jgi:hypothetical protein
VQPLLRLSSWTSVLPVDARAIHAHIHTPLSHLEWQRNSEQHVQAKARPALPQALLAEHMDQATRPGCQEGNESQQRWEFAYGQRAVRHGGRKREQNGGEDEDGGETGDSSDAGESETASNEYEGEEHDGDGQGQAQVKINKLSRWQVDGKIPGRVTVSKEREFSGEEGKRGQQIPDDDSYSDIQDSALENNDDDVGLDPVQKKVAEDALGGLFVDDSFQSNVSGSPEKEDQAQLRGRETADNQECLLCGEWGHGMKKLIYGSLLDITWFLDVQRRTHRACCLIWLTGIRNCPYTKPEQDLKDSYMPEQGQIVDYGDVLEKKEDSGRQSAEEQIVNEADGEARVQAEKEEQEKRSAMAAAVIQQSTR